MTGIIEGKILLPAVEVDPRDPPVFLLQASPTWAPWIADGNWQRVPIGASGQVLTVQADGSVGWGNNPAGFANPMTTAGDLLFENAVPVPARLAIGTSGQVLTVVGGLPAWSAAPAFVNPMTTLGDLIDGGSGGTPLRLGIGAAGQVLTVVSGAPAWANAPSGFANPMTTLGDLITGASGGTAQRLAVGTNGNVLAVVGGVPLWVASSTVGFVNPMTASQDLIVGGTAGAAGRLAVGGNGQVLGVTGGAVGWVNNPAGFANPMTTPQDLIVGGILGAAGRLAVGTQGQVLTVLGGAVQWATAPTGVIQPSGDTSGAADTAAINAALGTVAVPGSALLAAGQFYIGTGGSAATAVTVPYGATLRGAGAGLTLITQLNNGKGITSHSTTGAPYPANRPAATISDFDLDLTSAGTAAVGLDWGDGSDFRIDRVRISSNNITGQILAQEVNTLSWTEKSDINIQTYNGATHFVVGVAGGVQSHMYGWYRVHMNVQPGQSGCVFKNGAFMRNGELLSLKGNCYPDNSGLTGVWLDLSANDGAGNFCFVSQTGVEIKCETTGSGTAYWMAIKLGGTVNSSSNRMLNDHGGITFTGGNWIFDPAWVAAGPGGNGLGTGAWSFCGMINEPATYNPAINASNAPNKALSVFNASPSGFNIAQAPLNRQPTNPAATASTTLVAMGLGAAASQPCLYTPKSGGLVQVTVTGVGWTNTAAVQMVVGARFGTGAAPANGVADTFTRFGAAGDPPIQAASTTAREHFSFCDTLTLTPGTQYWFDLVADTSVAADTAQVSNVSMNFQEIY